MLFSEASSKDRIEIKKLTHLSHIEDNLFYGTYASNLVVKFLNDMFQFLKGNTTELQLSYKIDGAPSVMVASDFNGRAFVSTKAGEKKAAYTMEDCDVFYGHQPDLCKKMKTLLKYAVTMDIPKNEIWQGDFLFDEDGIKVNILNGEKYVMFIANTIWYAFPYEDPIAQKILKSKLGIAFHTVYKGDSWETLKIGFKLDINKLQSHPEIYYMNTSIPSIAGRITMTEEETSWSKELLLKVMSNVQEFGTNHKLIELNDIEYTAGDSKEREQQCKLNKNLLARLEKFKNKKVRDGVGKLSSENLEEFKNIVRQEYDLKRVKYKRQNDIQKSHIAERLELDNIEYFSDLILEIWETQNIITDLKEFFLNKMNPIMNWKHFTQGKEFGFQVSDGEGIVISDVIGNAMKVVSRMGFSRNNFSNEVIKGWSNERREGRNTLQECFSNIIKLYEESEKLTKIQLRDILIAILNQEAFIESNRGERPILKAAAQTKLEDLVNIQRGKGVNLNDSILVDWKCHIIVENRMEFARNLKSKGFIVGNKESLANEFNANYTEITSKLSGDSNVCPILILEYTPGRYIACSIKSKKNVATSTAVEESFFAILMWHLLNKKGLFTYKTGTEYKTINLLNVNDVYIDNISLRDIKGLENADFGSIKEEDLILEDSGVIKGYIKETVALYTNKKYFNNNPGTYITSRGDFSFNGTDTIRLEKSSSSIHTVINNCISKFKDGIVQKDSWNPSDIYIYKKNTNFENELKDIFKNSSIEDKRSAVNHLLLRYLVGDTQDSNGNEITPVSLMGVSIKQTEGTKDIHIEEFNIGRDVNDKYYDIGGFPIVEIKNKEIKYPLLDWSLADITKGTLGVNNMSGLKLDIAFTADNSGAELSYRNFTPSSLTSGMQIETVLIDSDNHKVSNGQGGKVPMDLLKSLFHDSSVLPDGVVIENPFYEKGSNLGKNFNEYAVKYIEDMKRRGYNNQVIKLFENNDSTKGYDFFDRMIDYIKTGIELEEALKNSKIPQIEAIPEEHQEDVVEEEYSEDNEENIEVTPTEETIESIPPREFALAWDKIQDSTKQAVIDRHKKEWSYWLPFLNLIFASSNTIQNGDDTKFRILLTNLVQFAKKRYKGAAPFIKVS